MCADEGILYRDPAGLYQGLYEPAVAYAEQYGYQARADVCTSPFLHSFFMRRSLPALNPLVSRGVAGEYWFLLQRPRMGDNECRLE